jgi:hypothetical protein
MSRGDGRQAFALTFCTLPPGTFQPSAGHRNLLRIEVGTLPQMPRMRASGSAAHASERLCVALIRC